MKRTPKKLLFFFILIAVAFVGYKIAFQSGSWRYKITVEVETPEGIKSGYAVRELSLSYGSSLNPDISNDYWSITGEAVVIDLGQKKQAFALIEEWSHSELRVAFPISGASTTEIVNYYNNLKSGTKSKLDRKYWPRLITFEDISDPKTVIVLSEGNDKPEIFKVYRIKNIYIEMSKEPIVWKLKKFLPAYGDPAFQKWFNSLPYNDARKVHFYDLAK